MKDLTPSSKYIPFSPVLLNPRKWPDNIIKSAPTWCSVDLRDGNQALINPMNYQQKVKFFKKLVEIGFKEIEIGFPSASETEFDFTRGLVENLLVPDDVFPQVLVQARETLITKTFQSLEGLKQAIVHVYNSTSEAQRRLVFKKDRKGIIEIARQAVSQIKELSQNCGTKIRLEYSPESFTGTELDFALEICCAVSDIWQPTADNKLILNLPATVELSTPNIYADQIEWFTTHLPKRENHIISVHTHNDRGTGIAATELALLAGADRVEGTLFGNGERTGNLDICTVALNMLTQGIDSKLDLSKLLELSEIYSECTGMDIHPRHPYAGSLVFTAFSGSHQDAIKKGMDARKISPTSTWEVPYLPIDPSDIGRSYEAIIRINSQSGKGGVAYILENEFGIELPKQMHPEFGLAVQDLSDHLGTEISPNQIYDLFCQTYLEQKSIYELIKFSYSTAAEDSSDVSVKIKLINNQQEQVITATGNGPIDGCKKALENSGISDFEITHYSERALTQGSESKAIAFIELTRSGSSRFGVGIDSNITVASIKAIFSALNRLS
jgi:2-isopropylmalate synthase